MDIKIIAGAAALSALTAFPAIAADDYIYASYSSPNATWNREGILPWLEKIEEVGGGIVNTEFIGGGSLVTSKTGIFALRDGTVDGTFIASIYHPTELPAMGIMTNLGPVLSDPLAASAAVTQTVLFDCPACAKEMEDWNIKFLSGWASASGQLLCREPVRTLDELRGKKIRATGYHTRVMEALGAIPVNVTVTDIYESLQRGMIDCSMGSAGWLASFSLGEQATQVTLTNSGVNVGGPLLDVRLDLWNEYTPEQRQVFLDTAAYGLAKSVLGYYADDTKALEAGKDRYTVMDPQQDLSSALSENLMGVYDLAVSTGMERGIANAAEIADTFLANYEEWVKRLEGVEKTPEAYAPLFEEHIYSRLSADS